MNWSLVYLISEWVIRVAMLVYVPQRRTAAASRTWLLFIFILPWPGLLLYAIFGRIDVPKRRVERQERAARHIRDAQEQMSEHSLTEPTIPLNLRPSLDLARRLSCFDVFGGNHVDLLTDYGATIDRLIDDIDHAQHHVHLLFYIFGVDQTSRRVVEAMARAERRGVNARVMMDAVGSKQALRQLAPGLREQGIEVYELLPVGLLRRNVARFDLRNHRKIAVIDGKIGYTGSQNIVDAEFVKGYPNEELMARLTGPAVAQLQAVLLGDYYFEKGRNLRDPGFFPKLEHTGTTAAQLVPSGPGYDREHGQELIVSMLHGAQERVVITTPYFVPDEPFLHALRTAARRGVEVHLVVSQHANQTVTQLAQRSFYEDLLESHIAVHLYQPRFLHAKHLTIDDSIAFVGTTNIDIRSFALNAEINLVLYDSRVVCRLRAVQENYFAYSEQLNAKAWKQRPLRAKVLQNIARLADSLL